MDDPARGYEGGALVPVSVTLILGSLTDATQQSRYRRTAVPEMGIPVERAHPWRRVLVAGEWWRAYRLTGVNHGSPPELVLWLLESSPPDVTRHEQLLAEGWKPCPSAVVWGGPVHCEATVIDRAAPDLVRPRQDAWLVGVLVPTQRTWACLGEQINVRVRCAEYPDTSSDTSTVVLIVAHDEDAVSGSYPYSAARGALDPDLQVRVRQCDALSADVSYLLGAPVVTGVDVVHVDLLHPDDLVGSLPADVTDELIERLRVLGVHQIVSGEQWWEDNLNT